MTLNNIKGRDRNSSIELLKLIAILLIVISHSLPYSSNVNSNSVLDLGWATTSMQYVILGFFHNMGQIGNNIFMICSFWFLLDSRNVNVKKIAYIVGDSFIISNLMLIMFMKLGYTFSFKYMLRQILPTTFGVNWFVTCYLLLYMIHPLLNKLVIGVKKKELLRINICNITLYCIMNFIDKDNVFFYNNLVGFVVIYFLIAYVKLYLSEYILSKKINVICILCGFAGWVLQNLTTNFLGLHIWTFADNNQQWNKLVNLCYIMIAIGAFGLMNRKRFYNKTINYISSLSLLIYVIHCNRIIRDYLRFDIFEYIYMHYSYDNLLGWVLLYAIASLIFGIVGAVVYSNTVQRIVRRCMDAFLRSGTKIYYKMENVFLRF